MDTKQLLQEVINCHSMAHHYIHHDHPLRAIAAAAAYADDPFSREITDEVMDAYELDLSRYLSEPERIAGNTQLSRSEYHERLIEEYQARHLLAGYYISGPEYYREQIEALHANDHQLKVIYNFQGYEKFYGYLQRVPNGHAIEALGFTFGHVPKRQHTNSYLCIYRCVDKYTPDLVVYRDGATGELMTTVKEVASVCPALESAYLNFLNQCEGKHANNRSSNVAYYNNRL